VHFKKEIYMFTSKPDPQMPEPQHVTDVHITSIDLDSRFVVIDPLPNVVIPLEIEEIYAGELKLRVDEEKQKEVGDNDEESLS